MHHSDYRVTLRNVQTGISYVYEMSATTSESAVARALQVLGILPRFYYVYAVEVTSV